MAEELPRKFRRTGFHSSEAADERAEGRVWVLFPGDIPQPHIVAVGPQRSHDRLREIKAAVFGEYLGDLVNHAPHQSELFPATVVVLVDDDALLTPQCLENPIGDWVAKQVGVTLHFILRGALIISGPAGAGLTTTQIEALGVLCNCYPKTPEKIFSILSSFSSP